MKIGVFIIGDIVGKPGRLILKDKLKPFILKGRDTVLYRKWRKCGGRRRHYREIADELFSYGIDVITTGDHVWDKKEIIPVLQKNKSILRPANYSPLSIGKGYVVKNSNVGTPIGVINLLGRVFMKPIDCPFRAADEILKVLTPETNVIFVDMHAEATSEKLRWGATWMAG